MENILYFTFTCVTYWFSNTLTSSVFAKRQKYFSMFNILTFFTSTTSYLCRIVFANINCFSYENKSWKIKYQGHTIYECDFITTILGLAPHQSFIVDTWQMNLDLTPSTPNKPCLLLKKLESTQNYGTKCLEKENVCKKFWCLKVLLI